MRLSQNIIGHHLCVARTGSEHNCRIVSAHPRGPLRSLLGGQTGDIGITYTSSGGRAVKLSAGCVISGSI